MSENLINKDYWNELYQSNDTGWDIGYPSPAIQAYMDQLENKNLSILIPGCGNSYEAEYLLQNGFTNITLIDIAPLLTQALEVRFQHSKDKVSIITGDFFEHEGKYDLILEQTFLSALPPSLRPAYADKMHSLLNPGGKLIITVMLRLRSA
jgi:methyl halide transferase